MIKKRRINIGDNGSFISHEIGVGLKSKLSCRAIIRFLARCFIAAAIGYCVAGAVGSAMGMMG
jgi:hypothetical protein